MKKQINSIIAIILTFLLLSACSNNATENSTINTNNSTNENTEASQTGNNKISLISEFSNGFAFVQYLDDDNTYCIDKTGKQLFKLENCNIYNIAKFNKKIGIIETTKPGEYILCDTKGNTYKAEDFNASRIVLDTDVHIEAFLDGYIILEKKEESYTGTKIEMSIIDSDFNTLVAFSDELAEKINNNEMNVNGTRYHDGYLYNHSTNNILNLRTGEQFSDLTQIKTTEPSLSYWANNSYGSEFENLEWGDIYNEITGEVISKVKDSDSIAQISFIKNLGLATYFSDNGTWFNIIDKDGNIKFEPIKAENAEIKFDGETILTAETCTVEKNNTFTQVFSIKTYNTLGKLLGEITIENWSSGGSIIFNDGVLIIYNNQTEEYTLYNSNLKKLF